LYARVAVLLAIVPLTACAQALDQEPVTSGPEVEAVQTWFQRYNAAINAGVLDQWASFVAEDAVILPPDEPPIIGMDEIRPRYAAVFDAYAFQFAGRAEEITVAGHLAVVRASIEETLTPKSGAEPIEVRGAWLLILRKQDGSWKLWRNMWSVFPPTTEMPASQ
jgi:uncharacterized protein (TIGR02246 family)